MKEQQILERLQRMENTIKILYEINEVVEEYNEDLAIQIVVKLESLSFNLNRINKLMKGDNNI